MFARVHTVVCATNAVRISMFLTSVLRLIDIVGDNKYRNGRNGLQSGSKFSIFDSINVQYSPIHWTL